MGVYIPQDANTVYRMIPPSILIELGAVIISTPQPCDDCISREAAKKAFYDKYPKNYMKEPELNGIASAFCLLDTEKILDNLPSVHPEQKTGHWIAEDDEWGGYWCSECSEFNADKDDYCPNCGAKMENKLLPD